MTHAAAARVAAALVVAAACLVPGGCRLRSRPNVLLLVMDTTRGDRCAFDGYARPTTPRLSEFAKDAVVYRDAWTPGAWTGPAHASLFTGLRPEHHGFYVGDRAYLDVGPATLAEVLAADGWDTACVTNNNVVAPEFGLTRGFAKIEALYKVETRPYPWAKATHELAAAWAEKTHGEGRPFFLFVNDMEPHLPYTPPLEDQRRFVRGGQSDAQIKQITMGALPRAMPYSLHQQEISAPDVALLSDLYDAEIAALDREVGALLDRLRTDGLLDDTIVVIASDHGEAIGDHHMLGHGYDLHRAIRHVPLIIRFPRGFVGGRVVDSVVRLEDVAPTILELCGLSFGKPVDGESLTHDVEGRVAFGGQGADDGVRVFVEKNYPGADGKPFAAGTDCVYDGRYHFIEHTDGRRELYDVTADPLELVDLSARETSQVARLTKLLAAPR